MDFAWEIKLLIYISDLQIAVTAVAITFDKNQALQASKPPIEKSQQRGKCCDAHKHERESFFLIFKNFIYPDT